MENIADIKTSDGLQNKINKYLKNLGNSDSVEEKKDAAKKIRFSHLFKLNEENATENIAGVCVNGVHYYDLKNIQSINNTGIASLIDLSKCLLEQGLKAQFLNVREQIKTKIKLMGLDDIIKCT